MCFLALFELLKESKLPNNLCNNEITVLGFSTISPMTYPSDCVDAIINYYKDSTSAPYYLDRQVHYHLVPVLKCHVQIHLKVNTVLFVLHRWTRKLTRKYHVHRNLQVSCHVPISYLNQLDLFLLAKLPQFILYPLESQHLQINRPDGHICMVHLQVAIEVVSEIAYFRCNFSLHFKFGDLIDVASYVLVCEHEPSWLRILEWSFDGRSTCLSHVNINWDILGQKYPIVKTCIDSDKVADVDEDTRVCLQELMVLLFQLELYWYLVTCCPRISQQGTMSGFSVCQSA